MKRIYEDVKIEIILFNQEDIITTSGTSKFGTDFDVEKILDWNA